MCKPLNFLKNYKSSKGYSLIEMAIVLVIFGAMSASAIQVYTLYKKNEIIDQNDISLLRAKQAVGDFREMYGRYPCPAKMDAVRGDVDYGYESRNSATGNCQAVAGGVLTATSNNGVLPNQDVFIGILPFRQLNLPEKLVSDGYKNRISYAVTGLLANDTTYNDIWGGITILDFNNNSATNPPDSVHFIVLSYNQNDSGAITQNGMITTPCPAATPETENCDNDSTFRVGLVQTDFDDLIEYSTSDSIQQWQLSNTNDEDIHLRRADSIAMGINETDSTAGFSEAEFLNAAEPAVIRAEEDVANSLKGQVLSNNICDKSGVNCFPSSAIAGQIADSEGMDCSPGYLIGIANGVPICENEITFSCPPGNFITGFHAITGALICDTKPPIKCLDDTLTTTCGDIRNVTAFFDGGIWYGYAYSGQYYTIDPLNIPSITAAASVADVKTYIDTLNDTPRTSVDAGPTVANAMVRDTFQCSAASWIAAPIRALERIKTNSNLSTFSPLYNTPFWPAEIGSVVFDPATPMSVDPTNGDDYHDCWCREDYRVRTKTCDTGFTGNKFRIEKHLCPQTGKKWKVVYGYDDTFCTCTPNIYDDTSTSCKSHFGYSGIGVKGNITKTYDTTCPGPVTTLINTSTDNCECPAQPSPVYTAVACPNGETNSFTYMGTLYTAKKEIEKEEWVCPGGPAPVKPITSSAGAGDYTAKVTVHTEPCVCDTTKTKPLHVNCAAGEQGTGKDYLLPWDCVTDTYDAPSAANLVIDDCHSCIWQAGTKRAGGPHSTGGIVKRNDPCPSCTGTKTCHTQVSSSPNLYDVWDGCYCAGQP